MVGYFGKIYMEIRWEDGEKLRVVVMAKQDYILIKSICKSIIYKLTHIVNLD